MRTGYVVRIRTIHRMAAEKQWHAATVLAIPARPRSPGPQEDSMLAVLEESEAQPEVVRISRPGHQDSHNAPRELRLDARLLNKYGFANECSGCVSHQLGLGTRRAHSGACRQRVYNLMLDDPAELGRMIRTKSG